jgi:hypothetical protein
VTVLIALGCQGVPVSSEAGRGDELSLSATPKPGTTLRGGETVAIEAVARYVLSSAGEGEVVLVVFVPGTGRNLVEPQPSAAIQRGSGEARLSAEIVVPGDTDRVGISVILATEPRATRSSRSKPAAQRVAFYPVR